MADRDARMVSNDAEIARRIVEQRTGWSGLCRDCIRFDTCTFPRTPARPIWGCDEYVSLDPLNPSHQPAPLALRVVPAETAALGQPRGLCRTCAHAPACTFPKPPGGVWQCEELA